MNVAIIGSRDYEGRRLVEQIVAQLPADTVVISGGARGPDSWAVQAAKKRGLQTIVYRADWSQGKGAGFARNTQIVEACDVVFAFWNGFSRGTADTMYKARKAGKLVRIFPPQAPRVLLDDFSF